ncbi:MAG: zinc-binding dehydrogenase [Verrucomicrobia bacterium]|jgi:zinc-binding alcohol dehydrogenase/oxidoreductase|nr:zinc-binding dehydrogenase [Verrucomicrobiota bacterium]
MKGLVLPEVKSQVELQDVPHEIPGPDEVIVKMKSASLNRRDYWITQGLYPKIVTPAILGSDGAGTIDSIGDNGSAWKTGDEVVIYPANDWGANEAAQSEAFTVLGMPESGTFAEFTKVNICQLFAKPKHLDWAETAAIPVAGITAYRALMVQGQLQPGQTVLITGIGGGVAVFAMQIALAAKATVYVTSSRDAKIQRSVSLGASGGFQYTESDWGKRCLKDIGPVDLIIDGAGGSGYTRLVSLLKPGGRLVNYGSTAGKPEKLDLFKIFWRQLSLIGSTLGSPLDFANLLTFMDQHQLKPIVDQRHPLADGPSAIAAMADSEQFGKVTLEM